MQESIIEKMAQDLGELKALLPALLAPPAPDWWVYDSTDRLPPTVPAWYELEDEKDRQAARAHVQLDMPLPPHLEWWERKRAEYRRWQEEDIIRRQMEREMSWRRHYILRINALVFNYNIYGKGGAQ